MRVMRMMRVRVCMMRVRVCACMGGVHGLAESDPPPFVPNRT